MNKYWTVVFYARVDGRESVLTEIKSFKERDYLKILKSIHLLENYGTNLSPDRIKHIKGKIWELKIDRYRVLYFPYGNHQFILLRAFMKKTDKTTMREIALALKRLADYTSRSKGD